MIAIDISSIQSADAAAPRSSLRRLGQTGLLVSPIGLGLAALGRPAYMTLGRDADFGADRSVDAMKRRCLALLDVAYDAGVRYVDAARSYGCAEPFLSAWYDERRLPDTTFTVGSKWGYTYTGGWQLDAPTHEVKRLSIDTLRRQAEESFAVLGTRLSLYQIHSVTLESGVLDDREVLTVFAALREKGVSIGITVTGPRQADVIRRALDVRVDGVPLVQTVQATWNVLEPSAATALAEARADGCGVILKEVLANGRLTNRHAGPELRELIAHAAALGTTLDTLAMAAALAQPWADVVLSGAATSEQLRSHLRAIDLAVDIGPSVLAAEPPDAYWCRRGRLAWS
jgi:aryl-alcohol dehydrogenase-like predicted oxidoreductase